MHTLSAKINVVSMQQQFCSKWYLWSRWSIALLWMQFEDELQCFVKLVLKWQECTPFKPRVMHILWLILCMFLSAFHFIWPDCADTYQFGGSRVLTFSISCQSNSLNKKWILHSEVNWISLFFWNRFFFQFGLFCLFWFGLSLFVTFLQRFPNWWYKLSCMSFFHGVSFHEFTACVQVCLLMIVLDVCDCCSSSCCTELVKNIRE